MKTLCTLLCVIAFIFAACRDPQPYGEVCEGDRDCTSHLCVSPAENATKGMCTRSCATDADCPHGHSCRGATNNGVVVCLPGPAVPIGGPPPR